MPDTSRSSVMTGAREDTRSARPVRRWRAAAQAGVPAGVRWLWLFLGLAAAVVYPALSQNIAALAYDAATEHVPRALLFSQAISDGVIYPRWVQFLHLGLGSPLFTFQGPLPYYGLDILYRLGLPHPIGWRILMAGGLLAAGAGTYLLVRLLTGQRWPAMLAAVAYMYAPYIIFDALERGSNEVFSVFLYPWVLWALVWLARRPSAGRFLAACLLWAACIAAHVLGPLMLAPVAVLVAVIAAWRYRTIAPLAALLVGGLLVAIVWAPMVPEQRLVHVERDFSQPEAIPAQNPISLTNLLAPPAVYDTARETNGSHDRVGLLQSVLLLLCVPATVYAWRRSRSLALYLGIATLLGLLLFWMFTGAADFMWRLAGPLLAGLLYRTRLMGLQALAVACACGFALALLPARRQRTAGLVLMGLLIVVVLPALYVGLQHRYADFDAGLNLAQVRAIEAKTGGRALTAFGEFTPLARSEPLDQTLVKEVGTGLDPQTQPLAHPPAGVQVENVQVKSSAWDMTVRASGPATLTLHLLYYPRWQATVDGAPAALAAENGTGYAQVAVPAGQHRVALRYAGTAAETAGLLISALTLIGLLAAWGYSLLRRARHVDSAPQAPTDAAGPQDRGPQSGGPREAATPPLVVLVGLTALLAFKIFYVDSGTTWLRCVSTPQRVCGAQNTVSVAFAAGTRLRGYSVWSPEVARGGVFSVDLYWQGDRQMDTPQIAFVHLRNSQKGWPTNPRTGSDIWVQADHAGPGGFFTTDYVPGRIYLDEYRVSVPADMPPGEYYLEIGWSNLITGEQMDPVADTVVPPLKVLWRSILLPSVQVK